MANKAPVETTANTVPKLSMANPATLPFPLDEGGFTSLLRREGVRAAGRIRMSEDKLKVYLKTLQILGQHAIARRESAVEGYEAEQADAVRRAEAKLAMEAADRMSAAAKLRAEAAAKLAEAENLSPANPE